MSVLPANLPYELRIGVTGHRRLSDPERIITAVDKLLDQIQGTLESAAESPRGPTGSKHSWVQQLDSALARCVGLAWRSLPLNRTSIPAEQRTPLHWLVVSPLAKGADQIVAARVLQRPQAHGRPRLQVVTPLPLDVYRRDFTDTSDLREFERLLGFDRQPHVLHSEFPERVSSLTPEQAFAARNEAYRAAGHRVVDSCEVLIAIWNGEQAVGLGGTGDVVRYAIEQRRMVLWINSNHPDQPARLLLANTRGDSPASQEKQMLSFADFPLPSRAKELSPNFHQLAAYNRDSAFDSVEYSKIVERILDELRRLAGNVHLPFDRISSAITKLLPHYARADQLAVRYQRLSAFAATWLHVLAAIAVSVAVLQILFLRERVEVILLEILAMMAAVILFRISKNESWHDKWLQDRHLAEQIRIRFIASLVGLRKPTRQSTAIVHSFYRGPDTWIQNVLDSLVSEIEFDSVTSADFVPLKRFLIEGWILNQAEYHRTTAARKKAALHRAHRWGLTLFLATLAMATLHWLHIGQVDHTSPDTSEPWLSLLIAAAAILLPAWGAAIHAINTLSENEKIAERSHHMASILQSIAYRAEQSISLDELRVEIQRVEEVMSAESHDWWVTLSFRNMVLPS